jgi:predicted RNase H-like nuclease
VTPTGGRSCELQARRILGSARARSVFSVVGRVPLRAGTRPEADRLSRERGGIGIGAQAWGLSKKLQEVDAVMTPTLQSMIREVHPELSFGEMTGRPPDHGKKSLAGERERLAALASMGIPESIMHTEPLRLGVGRDDFLDACAALWTAERIYKGTAKRIPKIVERDSRGLDMAMWF